METKSQSSSWFSTAWLAVILLVPVALLNYMDRQMLATMRISVSADVEGITTDADWGFLLACFKWTYAFLSPIGGYIADRVGRKLVIIVSLCVWSIVTWATGQVSTYDELLWTRALMGISEAFYIPAALALISDFHTGSTRARAVGIHQMGIYAGVILGGFTGYVADSPDYGWRWVFATAGLLGVVYAIPLCFLLKEPSSRPSPTSSDDELLADGSQRNTTENKFQRSLHTLKASTVSLLGNPSYRLMLLYFTLPALAGWIVRDWMPSILTEFFGISQGKGGMTATLSSQLAAIVGAIGGGWIADKWVQKTQRGRIYLSAIGVGLIVPALLGMGIAPGTQMLPLAIFFLVLFGIGWGFFDGNNMPILCQITKPEHRAFGYGFLNLVSISCGGIADWAFGAMRDAGFSMFAIFFMFSLFALISIPVVLSIRPSVREE